MEQPVVQDSSLAQVRETISTNVKGTVKWFHRVKGFGFITREDTNEDVFVHFTSIKPMSINLRKLNKKRLNLMDKEKVQFDVVKTQTGIEAVNVVGKNGYLILDIIALKRDIPPFDLEIINEARVTGKVKWFNVKIKYGFVHCDYNNEDVFVHSSAIIKNNPNKYKPSLNEGEPVEFDILKRADGKLEAVNVSGPQGTNVQGSRYSPDKINEGDETNKNYVEKNLVGKVKWFNVKAGFGFISRNDNGQDVYAHYSAISKKNPNHRVRSLADGEIVHFNIVQGSKGAEATDITGPSDLPVQGSQYARTVDSETRGSVRSTSRPQQQRPRRRVQPRNSFNNTNPQNRVSRVNNFNGPRPNRRQNNQNGSMNPNGYSQANRGSVNPYVGNQYVDQVNNYPNQNRPRRANYQSQPIYPPNTIPPYQPPMRIQPQQFPSYNNGNRYMNGNETYVGQDFNIQNGYYNQRMTQNQFDQNQLPPNMRFVDRRVPGVSKWYNFKNGFGFVTRTDTNQDIFVHKSGIQAANKSIPSLDDGEPVEFDVVEDGTRLLAINVTGPNGSLLRGSKYAPISNMRQSRPRTETQGFNSAQGQRTKVYQKRKFN